MHTGIFFFWCLSAITADQDKSDTRGTSTLAGKVETEQAESIVESWEEVEPTARALLVSDSKLLLASWHIVLYAVTWFAWSLSNFIPFSILSVG